MAFSNFSDWSTTTTSFLNKIGALASGRSQEVTIRIVKRIIPIGPERIVSSGILHVCVPDCGKNIRRAGKEALYFSKVTGVITRYFTLFCTRSTAPKITLSELVISEVLSIMLHLRAGEESLLSDYVLDIQKFDSMVINSDVFSDSGMLAIVALHSNGKLDNLSCDNLFTEIPAIIESVENVTLSYQEYSEAWSRIIQLFKSKTISIGLLEDS